MALEQKPGMMEVNMMGIIKMVKSKEKVFTHGLMGLSTMENGMIIKYVVKDFILGQMYFFFFF